MAGFRPPAGSLDVPHPRTPPDIILRTLLIQTFSAIAYAHLLYLLSFRRPHGVGRLSLFLLPAFLCMPYLLILQLAFSLLPMFIAGPYRRRVVARFRALPFELGLISSTSGTGLPRLAAHALFAVLNAVPLAAVLGAYRQRLGMRYHQMTYVTNLGLDHRNGWAAAGGLLSVGAALVVVLALVLVIFAGVAEPARSDELPRLVLPETDMGNGHARSAVKAVVGDISGESVDWSALLDVLYACAIHQFVLGATQHPIPVVLVFKAWFLWPFVGVGLWWLLTKQRVPLETLALGGALFLIGLTIVTPLVWDLLELYKVSHGDLRVWNFRWMVKDWVSVRHVAAD